MMRYKKFLTLALFAALAAAPAGQVWGQWVQTNGPYGCGTYCIAFQDTNLFVSTDSGVYVSHNYGGNWELTNQGLPQWLNSGSVFRHPVNPVVSLVSIEQDLYAATDTGIFFEHK